MIQSKLVTIETAGKLPVLGGIRGPIHTPTRLSVDIIIQLLNTGKIVMEVNPANYNEKIRLTRLNLLSQNFTKPSTVNKSPVAGAKAKVEEVTNKDVNIKASAKDPVKSKDAIDPITGEGMVGTDIFTSNVKTK